jgi:hypothetical protein
VPLKFDQRATFDTRAVRHHYPKAFHPRVFFTINSSSLDHLNNYKQICIIYVYDLNDLRKFNSFIKKNHVMTNDQIVQITHVHF